MGKTRKKPGTVAYFHTVVVLLNTYHWMHQATNGVPMENEATLEKIGDSKTNGAGNADESIARDEHETEAAVECSNGVCVLNWKPNRSAA